MTDLLTSAIGNLQSPIQAWVTISLCFVGIVIGYFSGLIKQRWEVKALRAQITTASGEMLANVQRVKKEATTSMKRCGILGSKLIDLLKVKAGATDVDNAREEFCDCLVNESIPNSLFCFEWERLDLDMSGAGPDSYCELVRDELLDLERFASWLSVINQRKMLDYLAREPQVLETRTLRPLVAAIERFPTAVRNEQLRAARTAIEKLTKKR